MKTILITTDMLTALGACEEQQELFNRTFPHGCTVSRANADRAAEAGLSCDWLAWKVLTVPALAEYGKVTAPAWVEREKVTARARAECKKATARVRAECEKVTARARAEYEKVTARALCACIRKHGIRRGLTRKEDGENHGV